MSFFSTLGSIGKSIGKVGLGAVGGVLGTATGGLTNGLVNSTMFDSKTSAAAVVAQPAAAAAVVSIVGGDTQNAAGSSLMGLVTSALSGFTSFVTGQTHAQVDVHTQIGGTADPYANTSSGLPSWLLPVGLGAAAIFLFTGNSGKGRR